MSSSNIMWLFTQIKTIVTNRDICPDEIIIELCKVLISEHEKADGLLRKAETILAEAKILLHQPAVLVDKKT